MGLQQEKDESQSGIESDGTDEGGCHFVRLKAQTEWDATDDAGAVMTDGNYETVVSAVFVREDILGNGEMKAKTVDSLSTVSASVKVDTVPPAISLLPENNLITSDRFLPIAVNVSDPLSGIDQSSMMLTLDGADLLKGLAMSDGEFTFVPPRAV
ncbi:MAG: hypothetical protein HYT87_00220 [Nitrospirae bacterium]|nr:hypothetical protein [Nitrospirota bacterium]